MAAPPTPPHRLSLGMRPEPFDAEAATPRRRSRSDRRGPTPTMAGWGGGGSSPSRDEAHDGTMGLCHYGGSLGDARTALPLPLPLPDSLPFPPPPPPPQRRHLGRGRRSRADGGGPGARGGRQCHPAGRKGDGPLGTPQITSSSTISSPRLCMISIGSGKAACEKRPSGPAAQRPKWRAPEHVKRRRAEGGYHA